MIPVLMLALAAVFVASSLPAQGLEALPAGTIMRIQLESSTQVTGRLAWVRGDSLAIRRQSNGDEYRVAIPAIQSYSFRQPRSRGAGAKRGALVGGGIGLVLVATSVSVDLANRSRGNVPSIFYVTPFAVAAPLLGSGIGALTGRAPWSRRVLLTGSASSRRTWLAVAIPF